jgi:hypothetical protein
MFTDNKAVVSRLETAGFFGTSNQVRNQFGKVSENFSESTVSPRTTLDWIISSLKNHQEIGGFIQLLAEILPEISFRSAFDRQYDALGLQKF